MKTPTLIAAIAIVAILHSAMVASAQVARLPAVEASPETSGFEQPGDVDRPRNLFTGYPRVLSQPLLTEGQPSAGPDIPGGVLGGFPQPEPQFPPPGMPAPEPELPKGAKPGVFQQALFAETYLPRIGGDEGLGMNDLLVQATFGLPCPTRDCPLLITPAFEAQLLDGPTAPDLPPQLFDMSVEFFHITKFSDRFSLHVAASPGWHSDLQQSNSQALRVPARVVGVWQWRPNTQIVLGILYLDRDDLNFLPVAGAIWTPNDDVRLELLFPRPRYARRFIYEGDIEWWWYVAGEFGGGSYAIERASGADDVVTLSDWRALLGVERRVTGGINSRMELGYVFNRQIDYESGTPTFKPDSTLLVRGGLTY